MRRVGSDWTMRCGEAASSLVLADVKKAWFSTEWHYILYCLLSKRLSGVKAVSRGAAYEWRTIEDVNNCHFRERSQRCHADYFHRIM